MKQVLTAIIFMISVNVFSQNKTITGKVTHDTGESLPGTNILEKGTSNGVQTDVDGNFSITVANEKSILVISYIGFTKKEVIVGNQTKFSIVLEADNTKLNEVVVIGYGTVKKKDLTGSVSTIDTKSAYIAPVANLNNALQGRASGVQVTSSSGEPGSNASIRIRGGNSISAGNAPLYVIDGFVGAGDLSTLNPNDIESMQILKDASSTAIYGARGTNGVILITTKKGKIGKPKFNFTSSVGIQKLPRKVGLQTGSEFAQFINNSVANPSNGLPFDLNNLPGTPTDWQDVLIGNAPMSDYQLSVSGGNENTQYYISGGILSQDGIVKSTGFKRYSLRTNIDMKLSKIFKTGISLSLSRTGSDNNNINFVSLIREDPLKPPFKSDGTYETKNYGVSNTSPNLLANNELNLNETTKDRALINTYIEASIGKNIKVRSTFGGDFNFNKQNEFIPSTNPTSIINKRLGAATITRYNDLELLNENTINYNKEIGKHAFNVVGGITAQKQNRETVIINASQIPSDGVGVNAVELAPKDQTSINSNYSEFSLFSTLGRVNYTYNDRYLFTATLRRDGSSRLGINNKYANFPSAAVAWKLSEESFIKNIKAIDNLKLRASFGTTGNQGINPFSTLSTFNTLNTATIINGVASAGVQQGTLASPDLKWESTAQYDLALEFSLFKGRLSGVVDYYYKKTTDLLLEAEVPFFTGFTTTIQNVGSLQNKGFDFDLNGVIIENKNFSWTTGINISTYKNKVLGLGNKSFIVTNRLPAPSGDINSQLMVGQPVGIFWGAIYKGIDPATGDALFEDISGPDGVPDGKYSAEYDKTVIGNSNPDFFGGVQSNFKFKSFDLLAFFPFSVGNQNYNEEIFLGSEIQVNSFASVRDNIWTLTNKDNADFPKVGSPTSNTSNSSYVQDASFFRLGTLQFGYTLPKGLVKGISSLRAYCTGTNLFLLKSKGYLGYDPDVNSYGDSNTLRGFDRLSYPQNRSILVGLNITF